LIAHWNYDDGTGNNAADSSGNGNSGSLEGGPSWVTGKFGGGLSFDGVDDFVEVAHSDAYLLSEGTVAFWFKTDTVVGSQGLFSKDSNGFDTGGHLTISIQNSRVSVRIQSTGASFEVESGVVQTDRWYHVALTFGSGGLMLYVDGVSFTGDAYTGGLIGNREPIAIGAASWRSDNLVVGPTSDYFGGVIDDVRIYNRALTSAEVIAIVSPPPPPPPPPPSAPPVTSILCDGVACETDPYSDPIVISFTCSDDTGCESTKYCVDADNTCAPNIEYVSGAEPIISNPGTNYVRYSSVDVDGNVELTKAAQINVGSDTGAPVVSDGRPSGVLAGGTVEDVLSVVTDEGASCKFSDVAGLSFDDGGMKIFSTTGGTSHSSLVGSLVDGVSYAYYVRCRDAKGNSNDADFEISFSVGDGSLCGDGSCFGGESCSSCSADCGSCPVTSTSTTSSSGGGGGGSGGGSSTSTSAFVSEKSSLGQSLVAGDVGSFVFEKFVDDVGVFSVDVVSGGGVVSPSLTVRATVLSDSVASPANSNEVLYATISLTGDDLDSAGTTVRFKVRKSWLFANNVDAGRIVLKRLKSGTWESLATVLDSEEISHYLYSSVFDGLSIFAIVGEKIRRSVVDDLVGVDNVLVEVGQNLVISDFDIALEALEDEPLVSGKRFRFAFKQVFMILAVLAGVFLLFEVAVKLRQRHRLGGLNLFRRLGSGGPKV